MEVVRKNLLPDDKESPSYDDQMEEFRQKTDEINAKEEEIKNKKAEIEAKQKEKDTTNEALKAINDELKIENYFTREEQIFLSDFLIEQTYTDSNFVVTDDMKIPADLNEDSYILTTTGLKKVKDLLDTDVIIDEQYIANQLLEQGMQISKQLSQPQFQFSLESTNFLFQERFLPFIKQLELGSIINIEIKDGDWAYPLLHEMTINYDDPTNFSMTFSNRFRLSDAEWTFAELHNETVKTTTQVGTGLQIAKEPVLNGSVSEFEKYMNGTLTAANQQIQSTVDNEITIGSFGLRGRKKNDEEATGYDPHQLWINNNLICMTDDNWQSTKLAIGFINGVYSVNAEVIAGTLIAGSQLTISNESNSFVVDANGVKIDNASMTITTASNQIILNPDVGIKLQKKNGENWEDKLYFSSNGDLNFSGKLTAATGVFSGTVEAGTINSSEIYGSYIEGGEIIGSSIDGGSVSGSTIYFGSGKSGATLKGSGSSGATLTCNNGVFTIMAKPTAGTDAYVNILGNLVLGSGDSWAGIDMSNSSQSSGYLLAGGGESGENDNFSIYARHGVYGHERIKTRTVLESEGSLWVETGIKFAGEWLYSWSGIKSYLGGRSTRNIAYTDAVNGLTYNLIFENGILMGWEEIG